MKIELISMLVLAVVVAIGFIKKINMGYLAIGVAYILGLAGGLSSKQILSGFSGSMLVTLLGVTFLFGIASVNGTLELISNKIIALVGKRTYFIPITLFVLSAFLSAIGPGHIAIGILMTTFAVYLAVEMEINPFATALYAKLGANAGSASAIAPAGVLAANLAEPLGYSGFEVQIFLTTLFSGFIFMLILYIAYKGYKVSAENPLKLSDIAKFNREQRITILVIGVVVVLSIGLKMDVGLFSFFAASILILLKCVDEKKALKGIPWGTLILIVGVGMLVSVITDLGGITMISEFLIGLMTDKTAVPIIALTSGILSWVSSTTGVVMPAMFPIAAEIAESMGGASQFNELICAITATSFAAAVSPLSTGGAIILSSYSSATELSAERQNQLFKTLFLLSVANVGLNVLISFTGFFGLFGLM